MRVVSVKAAQKVLMITAISGLSLFTTACQLTPTKKTAAVQTPVLAQESQSGNGPDEGSASDAVQSPTAHQASPAAADAAPSYSPLEKRFLAKAEAAFRKGNFFYPTHDNAFDRFNAVLLLNPDNQQAKAGLQAILLRYTTVTRESIGEGRLSSAKSYLQELEEFYPDQPLVKKLRRQFNEKQKTMYRPKEQIMKAEKHLDYEEIKLSGTALGDRSKAVVEALSSIAQRLQSTDESILIFARSDKEGRWIYKQMKQAVNDYRIRGDIRISSTPRIRILPPL
ncbi:hypothetical protein TDB9533_00134 [Thalassocella blandensis]|nr:hypothetical protein TDB9533_00134 [Thalassocella blandensis]